MDQLSEIIVQQQRIIAYLEYLALQLDRSITYSEYLRDNLQHVFDTFDELKEVKTIDDIAEDC